MLLEGFYIEIEDVIAFVKGVVHPPNKVFAFPKYVPTQCSVEGARARRGSNICFRKLETIEEQMRFVREWMPNIIAYDEYLGLELPAIPLNMVDRIFNPIDKARELLHSSNLVDDTLRLAKSLVEDLIRGSGVSTDSVGISGSILVDLYTESSDIDIVVYGEKEGRKVYEFLKQAVDNPATGFKRYGVDDLARLYRFRARETPMDFNTFVAHERRRVLEGIYRGREYFVRLVLPPREWERYGCFVSRRIGEATIRARIADSSQSIYTPCRYLVRDAVVLDGYAPRIDEIYSLRGRFCELADNGHEVVARGYVEKIVYLDLGVEVYRLHLVDRGHFMVNKSLGI